MKKSNMKPATRTKYQNTDEILKLIKLVEADKAIYNPRQKNYSSRRYHENFWKELDIKLGKIPGVSLAKWTSLRQTFRKEYGTFKYMKERPPWMFFDAMYFLHPYLTTRERPKLKLENHVQKALDDIKSITRGNIIKSNNVQHNITPHSHSDVPDIIAQAEIIFDVDIDDENNFSDEKGVNQETYTEECEEYEIETIDSISEEHESEKLQSLQCYEKKPSIEHDYIRLSYDSSIASYDQSTNNLCAGEASNNNQMASQSLAVSIVDEDNKKKDENSQRSQSSSLDWCKCKSDPDAMFLMSLLPDIQSLSGRNKGKLKIEIQKIIQNLLYPED